MEKQLDGDIDSNKMSIVNVQNEQIEEEFLLFKKLN